jgi:hypothetical protein
MELLDSLTLLERYLTKMEIVVVAVSEEHESPNDVDEGFRTDCSLVHIEHLCQLLWRQVVLETTHAWQMSSSQSNEPDIFLVVPSLSRRGPVLAVASRKS